MLAFCRSKAFSDLFKAVEMKYCHCHCCVSTVLHKIISGLAVYTFKTFLLYSKLNAEEKVNMYVINLHLHTNSVDSPWVSISACCFHI